MLEVHDYVTKTLLFGQETHMTLLVRDRIMTNLANLQLARI